MLFVKSTTGSIGSPRAKKKPSDCFLQPCSQYMTARTSCSKYIWEGVKITRRWLQERNRYSTEIGVEIRSFDALTDHMKTRPILDFCIIGNEIGYPLSHEMMNQLVNPFAKAYSDKVWREMVADPSFRLLHMLTTNVPLLLRNRDYSKSYASFLKYWNGLPGKVRDGYLESSKGHRRLLHL